MRHDYYVDFCSCFLMCQALKNTLEYQDLIYQFSQVRHPPQTQILNIQAWPYITRYVNGMTMIDTISGYYSDQDQSHRLQKPVYCCV